MWKILKKSIQQHRSYFKYWYKWNYFLLGVGTNYIKNLDEEGVDKKLGLYLKVQQHRGWLFYSLLRSIWYRYQLLKKIKRIGLSNIAYSGNEHKYMALDSYYDTYYWNIDDYRMLSVQSKVHLDKNIKITTISDNVIFPIGENIYITKEGYYGRNLYELFNSQDYVVRDMIKTLVSEDIVNFENQILQRDVKNSVEKVQ